MNERVRSHPLGLSDIEARTTGSLQSCRCQGIGYTTSDKPMRSLPLKHEDPPR